MADHQPGPDDLSLLVFRRAATPAESARALTFLGVPAFAMARAGCVLHLLIDVAAGAAGLPVAAAIVTVSDDVWTIEGLRADEDWAIRRIANEIAMAAVREGARALAYSSSRFGQSGEVLRRVLRPGKVVAGSFVVDL